MPVVTLTFANKGISKISGIPEFVEITSNTPSTIYYTLDGTLPTAFSTLYTSEVNMPALSTVTLSAIAYYLDGYGSIVPSTVLTKIYINKEEGIGGRIRRLGGVVYIYPGGSDIPFWYDSTGVASVFVDIPVEELQNEIKPSERNIDGSIRENVSRGVISLTPYNQTVTRRDDPTTLYGNPASDVNFDPKASVIVVDGRNPRSLESVLMVNGPHMSLRDSEKNFGGIDFLSTAGTNYNSGSLVRAHYSRDRGIIVFYYFDSNTSRWIKSIQKLDAIPSSKIPRGAVITNPVVFKWNNWGRHQSM